MSAWLPMKYNLLLFLVSALLIPVVGLFLGSPFDDPSVASLLLIPVVIIIGGNLSFYIQARDGKSDVVDERDIQNLDFALISTGVVLLASIVAIYTGYATTSSTVPAEINYLALAGVLTVFVILGGTEVHQRL